MHTICFLLAQSANQGISCGEIPRYSTYTGSQLAGSVHYLFPCILTYFKVRRPYNARRRYGVEAEAEMVSIGQRRSNHNTKNGGCFCFCCFLLLPSLPVRVGHPSIRAAIRRYKCSLLKSRYTTTHKQSGSNFMYRSHLEMPQKNVRCA